MKIISVDDSDIIAKHLDKMFDKIDGVFYLGHAFTISEAIDLLKNHLPEIIFLDIALKEENGIEFLSYIKSNHPQIKVIMLSNHSELFYKNKTKDLGADHFLDKSYEFDKIPEILSRIKMTS
jgi:DNA-binding NarL/FixJ family response regulator